jgi:hypothetical protein
MANKKRRCVNCKEYFFVDEMLHNNAGWFCSVDCVAEYAANKVDKEKKKAHKAEKAAKRASKNEKEKELMTRTQWYAKLQRIVNQYVRWRDRDEPCCTCGTTNQNIKYDAGHFIAQKIADPRRFELTNIHKQCSVKCNVYGAGKRKEYRDFIISKYGQDHLEWLECDDNHKPLKEVFPHWTDIEKEIVRYRKLLRDVGVKPCV